MTVGYQDALGYRSRRAAEAKDAAAFVELMQQASEADPNSALDNPKKTVLTHFLDLADSPQFLATVDDWNRRGWVDEDMICPVYRAHFAAHFQSDPEAAASSAAICEARARAASHNEARAWEVDLCLLESPVFTRTSTESLGRYLQQATDPQEPEAYRQALLKALTFREHFGPRERWGVPSTLSPEAERAQAREGAEAWRRRLAWLLEALSPAVPTPELAIASARGVMEVEQVMLSHGQSFVATYADSPDPTQQALAWAWVRALKRQPPVDHLAGLGIWDRGREPVKDAYWYLCHGPAVLKPGGALGPRYVAPAVSMRSGQALEGLDRSRPLGGECQGFEAPAILGPYPLEQIARARAVAQLKDTLPEGSRVVLQIRRRKVLD